MAKSAGISRVLKLFVLHLKTMELELNCSNCLKFLNQPMLLPCDHILCSHCSEISTNDEYNCPDCRLPFECKDLRSANHIERFLTIYKNMSAAISTLQQSYSFEISDLEVHRSPVSCNNHTTRKHTHITRAESFVDQGPLTEKFRDSDIDSWDKEEQLGAKRKSTDMLPEEGSNRDTKHARLNDSAEPMKDQLKNVLMGGHTNVDLDGSTIETCSFCHSFRTTEASGEMLHYLNEEPISREQASQPNVLHVHRKCIEWSPQVYFSGEKIVNLEVELLRSSKIKCSKCGLKGAALGCYIESCRRSYHVPCAYEILECRWDIENYLVLCPAHASRKLPCEKLKSNKSKKSLLEPYDAASITKRSLAIWTTSSSLTKDWLICGSDLSKEEKVILEKFSRLSGVPSTYQWKQNVTHVVAATNEDGACIRTMKFLMAILNGRWVLNVNWIRACLEVERLVPEEVYEITHDIHDCYDGPKSGRLRAKQKSPKLFNRLAFHFNGFIEISYKSYLERLAIEAGGKVLSKFELQNQSSSISSSTGKVTERTFIVYSVEPPKDCNPLKIDQLLQQRLKIAEALAVKPGTIVVRHTLFLNAIAVDDMQMLYENF